MTWARAMGEFGATLMFAGNLPGTTATMPLAIYTLLFSSNDPSAAITLSVILIVLSFAVLVTVKLLEQKRFGGKR